MSHSKGSDWKLVAVFGSGMREVDVPAVKLGGFTIIPARKVMKEVPLTPETVRDKDEVARRYVHTIPLISALHVFGAWKTPRYVLYLLDAKNTVLATEEVSFSFNASLEKPIAELQVLFPRYSFQETRTLGANLVFRDEAELKSYVRAVVISEQVPSAAQAQGQGDSSCFWPLVGGLAVGALLS